MLAKNDPRFEAKRAKNTFFSLKKKFSGHFEKILEAFLKKIKLNFLKLKAVLTKSFFAILKGIKEERENLGYVLDGMAHFNIYAEEKKVKITIFKVLDLGICLYFWMVLMIFMFLGVYFTLKFKTKHTFKFFNFCNFTRGKYM